MTATTSATGGNVIGTLSFHVREVKDKKKYNKTEQTGEKEEKKK